VGSAAVEFQRIDFGLRGEGGQCGEEEVEKRREENHG
jgi:hypothetical protein